MNILPKFLKGFKKEIPESMNEVKFEEYVESLERVFKSARGPKRSRAILNSRQGFFLRQCIRSIMHEKDTLRRIEKGVLLLEKFDELKIDSFNYGN